MSSEADNKNVTKTFTDPETGKFIPGNPGGGKPLGSKHKSTLIREAFIRIAEQKGMTPEELDAELEKVGIDKAMKGDFKFWQDIRDRNHGKPVQRSENVNMNADLHKLQEEEKERLDDLIK